MVVQSVRTISVLTSFFVTFWASAAAGENRLSLQEAVALARARRPEIAGAELDVRLARLGMLRAGLSRVQLGLEGRWGEQVEHLYVNAPPGLCASIEGLCQPTQRRRVIDLSATLEVPLWTGMRLEAGWSKARQLERAAQAQQRSRRRTLTLEVAEAYWTVRLAELLRDTAERALVRRTGVANILQARADAGLAPRTDF